MIIEHKGYTIKLLSDRGYDAKSADNLYGYKFVYEAEDIDSLSPNKHAVNVYKDEEKISSAIVISDGGHTVIHPHCYVLTNDAILLCCGNSIFCLSLPGLALRWNKYLDIATCFGIHPLEDDFAVHGELEISRMTRDGVIKWQTHGRDIFVSTDKEESFYIQDQNIHTLDWEGTHYLFDSNGNRL